MDPDILFISVYPCPRCSATLEAPPDSPDGWLRCPSCGAPSLPPESTLSRWLQSSGEPTNGHATGLSGDALLIRDESRRQSSRFWTRLVIVALGAAVPISISVALGRDSTESVLFGLVTAGALALLIRPGGRT